MSNGSPDHHPPPDEEGGLSDELEARIIAFDEALERGEALSDSDAPALAGLTGPQRDQVEGILQCLKLLDRARHEGPITRGLHDTAAPFADSTLADANRTEAPLRIGRFEIEREIGRGGHGVVFLARDTGLNRTVAVKVPRPEFVMTENMRRRFLFEARSAAGLSHENILRVYEVGESGPICHIVQELCLGPSLQQWLAARKDPVATRTAALIIRDLACGVQHAHGRGVGHRDIKPGNVLLQPQSAADAGPLDPAERTERDDAAGNAGDFPYIPKLADFGIAKVLDATSDETITYTGVILGTAAYMAPEQAAAKRSLVGTRTDIYALGVILYELLAGRPPFSADNNIALLRSIIDEEPTPPRLLRRDVPRDLDAICLKCLEKQPENRYASASDLALDLSRYLRGEPVEAHNQSEMVRSLRRMARRRFPAKMVLPAALLTIAAVVALGFGYWTALRDHDRAAAEVTRRDEILEQERATAYLHDMRQAADIWHDQLQRIRISPQPTERIETLLRRYIPQAGQKDLRQFEWHYLWRLSHLPQFAAKYPLLHSIDGHASHVYYVTFSPDSRRLLSASADRTVGLWDVATGKLLRKFLGHDNEVNCAVFSPDQKRIASCGDDGTVRLWNAETGELIKTSALHGVPVVDLSFSSDGAQLASGDDHGKLRIWNGATLDEIAAIDSLHVDGAYNRIKAAQFSPNGRWLLGGNDHTVNVWRTSDLTLQATYDHVKTGGSLCFGEFHPDGRGIVLAGTSTPRIQAIIEPLEGRGERWMNIVTPSESSEIQSVRMDPAGRTLVTSGRDLRQWDVATGQTWGLISGEFMNFWHAAFSPDGTKLAAAAQHGQLFLFDARQGPHMTTLMETDREQPFFCFPPGGGAWTVQHTLPEPYNDEGTWQLRVRDQGVSPPAEILARTDARSIQGPRFSPDGTLYAIDSIGRRTKAKNPEEEAWYKGDVKVFERTSHRQVAEFEYAQRIVKAMFLSADNRYLLAVLIPWDTKRAREIKIWDLKEGSERPSLPAVSQNANSGEFYSKTVLSPDGRFLATNQRNVEVYSFPDLRPLHSLTNPEKRRGCIAFSTDSTQIVVADRSIRFYDTRKWEAGKTLSPPFACVDSIAFSPDGTRLVVASEEDRSPALYDVATGQLLMRLPEVREAIGTVHRIQFSADGHGIGATTHSDALRAGNVVIWQARNLSGD